MRPIRKQKLKLIYKRLFRAMGPQDWWPGRTRFEVMVGAILTQNTAWTNVEKAIKNLRGAGALTPEKMSSLPVEKLASLIRPSGYYNVKSLRLKSLLRYMRSKYGLNIGRMARVPTQRLREELLSVSGIGKETADSMLLYAFDKPVFVVDAYTKRFLTRHGIASLEHEYDDIQNMFTEALPKDAGIYNEYHALIVNLGKNHCRPSNYDCSTCPLRGI